MRYRLAAGARPQAKTLLFAAAISIALWFIPYAEILAYPFRIFVTFIHEGGHAIAALVTGNSVLSLSVSMNGAGETYTTQGGTFSQMFVSSAGYLGAMAFGAVMLVLIRRAAAARVVLFSCLFFDVFIRLSQADLYLSRFFRVERRVYFCRRRSSFTRALRDRTMDFATRGALHRQHDRGAMYSERAARSENSLLSFIAVCGGRPERRRQHVKRDRRARNFLVSALDRRRGRHASACPACLRRQTRSRIRCSARPAV